MTAEDSRARFEAAAAAATPYPAGRYDGRGIVICAGGIRLFTCAWVLIGILRRELGCTLPIQVWHLGPEEMGPPMRALLAEMDVEIVDAHAVARRHPVRRLGGWELKPYAIIHSRFQEVMLIDADNVPAIDPTPLFGWPEYEARGALFWPDVVRLRADNPIWDLSGVVYCNAPSFESGQILVDKHRCWRALQLTLFMNEHSDLYYRHLHGDKDTFMIAWRKLGQPFAMTPHPPVHLSEAFYQKDFDGRVVFQHRSNAKWIYGRENPRLPGFQHEAACLALLEELHERWTGRVFAPPAQSSGAAAMTRALEAIRWLDCHRIGMSFRRLELLPANSIGKGRGDDAFYWFVDEDSHGLRLTLEGRRQTEAHLRRASDGSWSGRSLGANGAEIELRLPSDAAAPSEERDRTTVGNDSGEDVEPLLALLLRGVERINDEAARRDLAGALRLLAAASPSSVAEAMARRLASATDPTDPISRCMADMLAGLQRRHACGGEGTMPPQPRRPPIAKNYERPG